MNSKLMSSVNYLRFIDHTHEHRVERKITGYATKVRLPIDQ